MSKYLWILDNGHGDDTPGKRSPVWNDGSQLFEHEFNRAIVDRMQVLLIGNNISHAILVPECEDISLTERCKRANVMDAQIDKPSILISVHGNAAGVEGASGYEVFTSPGETKSDNIATIFYNKAKDTLEGFKMRSDNSDGDPDKEARFYILVHTRMPAILTENGFFTNENECKKMMSDKYKDLIAKAHVAAILEIEKDIINYG